MPLKELQAWCQEAKKILGTPGEIATKKYDELLKMEDEIAGHTVPTASWNQAKLDIGTALGAEKDERILALGRHATASKALFGPTALTEGELIALEPVAAKYGEMVLEHGPTLGGLGDKTAGKLGKLTNVEGLREDAVEELKQEAKSLHQAIVTATRTNKSAPEAQKALDQHREFLEGVEALDKNFARVTQKYNKFDHGDIAPTDKVKLARIESLVADLIADWNEAEQGMVENKTNTEKQGRIHYGAVQDRIVNDFAKWQSKWKKVPYYTAIDPTSPDGLKGLQDILDQAWDLAGSDEYAPNDAGLKAMKDEVENLWQFYVAGTVAQRIDRRGVTASDNVRGMNTGRTWKRSYKIGTGLYRLSESRSAGVSFKRVLPDGLRVPGRPKIRSFIYHLRGYDT